MHTTRWRLVREITERVLDEPRLGRDALLSSLCGGDSQLHADVSRLLDADQNGESFERQALRALSEACLEQAHSGLVGTRIGPYRLESVLATGGSSVVYRGVRADGAFDRTVAIKLIGRPLGNAVEARRFRDETAALARLEHPHVARMLDGGVTSDGFPYLILELVRGEPITAHARSERWSVLHRLDVFAQVCDAIEYLHAHRVLHRDLKPAHVLIDQSGAPKLLDFGLARILGDDEAADATVTRHRACTPAYASPEQLLGEPTTARSDVYSLGMVLYELLAGALPHDGATEPRLRAAPLPRPSDTLAREEPAAARRLRGDIDRIVAKALCREPADRFQSAAALADDLRRHRRGEAITARPLGVAVRLAKSVRRHARPIAWTFAALAALFAAGLGLWSGERHERERERREAAALILREQDMVSQFLQRTLDATNPVPGGRPTSALGLLAEAARSIDEMSDLTPRLEARFRHAIARAYDELWQVQSMEPQIERAVELLRASKPGDDALLADCLTRLGRAHSILCTSPRPSVWLREALGIRTRLLGPRHPLTMETRSALGYAEAYEGRDARALATLSFVESQVDLSHPDAWDLLARNECRKAVLYERYGRLDLAEQHYRRSIELFRLGPDEVRLAATMDYYGRMLLGIRREDEGRALIAESRRMSRYLNHPPAW